MFMKQVLYGGKVMVLACDGQCNKAWGINSRPSIKFDEKDPDDNALLADNEVGDAPTNPGTYEGGHGKPNSPAEMNKWCSRECERSSMAAVGEPVVLRDFTKRCYNQPWKHEETAQ